MAVPTVITDCNTTLASNSPAGTDSVGTNMDDYFRAAYGFIAQLLAATQSNAYTAFTTGGTSTAYTLTPSPAITALAANQRFRVKFNAASGATPTLAVSGLTAKNLKYYDSAGAKQAITSTRVPLNWISDVEYDGTDWVVLQPAVSLYAGVLDLSNAAAGQVRFPATQNASADANTFDDYEEGTWTATFACGTSGSISIGNATGTYIKVGGIVHISGVFDASSVSSPVGTLTLNGLPFTSANNNRNETAVAVYFDTTNALTGLVYQGYIPKNTAGIVLNYLGQASGSVGTNMAAQMKGSSTVRINASYPVI